eukprot:5136778-Pyramimonas_sp.AAC.1
MALARQGPDPRPLASHLAPPALGAQLAPGARLTAAGGAAETEPHSAWSGLHAQNPRSRRPGARGRTPAAPRPQRH